MHLKRKLVKISSSRIDFLLDVMNGVLVGIDLPQTRPVGQLVLTKF